MNRCKIGVETSDTIFTKSDVIESLSRNIRENIDKDDTNIFFIDFSCGTNEFAEQLGFKGKSFDINETNIKYQEDRFVKEDWLSVDSIEIEDGSELLIGINPPFGYKGTLAKKFILHAMDFDPKYIALILPLRFKFPDEFVSWYKQKSNETLPVNGFYDPDNNEDYQVDCLFTFWQKRATKKSIYKDAKSTDPEV